MIGDLLSGSAVPAFKLLASLGKRTLEQIRNSKEKVETYESLMKYPDEYRKKYSQISSLYTLRKESIELEHIYTEVKLLNYSGQTFIGYEYITNELEYDIYGRPTVSQLNLKNADEIDRLSLLDEDTNIAILGSVGSGKSTFLKKVGLDELKRNNQAERLIPIFIELKDFGREENHINLKNYLVKTLTDFGVLHSNELVQDALRSGSFLILLDGLDEVPRVNRNSVSKHIKKFSNKYSKNRFILSCRTAVFNTPFPNFKRVVIADFDGDKVNGFIENWFRDKRHDASELIRKLGTPQNAALKELSHNPLLLTFICLVYEKRSLIPPNRSSLYGKALDIILDEWAAENEQEKSYCLENLKIHRERLMLAKIAYNEFKNGKLIFSKQVILNQIDSFLSSNSNIPKNIDPSDVLDEIVKQQGILLSPSINYYAFSHLTFQEYLAARHICNKSSEVSDCLRENFHIKRWREFFILISGLLDESDDFLQQLEEYTRTASKSPLVFNLLTQSNNLAKSCNSSQYSDFHKRLIAFIIVGSLAIVRSHVIVIAKDIEQVLEENIYHEKSSEILVTLTMLSDFFRDKMDFIIDDHQRIENLKRLTSKVMSVAWNLSGPFSFRNDISSSYQLAKELKNINFLNREVYQRIKIQLKQAELKIGSNSLNTTDSKQTFVRNVQEIWFRNLEIQTIQINDDYRYIDDLCKYLNVVLLLFECKSASNSVSTITWKTIKSKLFLVDSDSV
ncbi:putative NTPase (NACHT family) [Leptolyngbya sp. PCC 7375]|nr:putative NTPase (NACHT family) [Leptolyngbya sp. PCC 7375]